MAFESPYLKYQPFIEDNLRIIDLKSQRVPFLLNPIQRRFHREASGMDVILKARRQGFSSDILAVFYADFLLIPDSYSVVVADDADNAIGLLDRVKLYNEEWEDINHVKVPLKYNSKYELVNAENGARYTIGTAQNVKFGRSRTITNLHLSEAAFYPHLMQILAGAGSAVVPGGKFVIETTANGFNDLKTFWDNSVLGLTGFKPLFFKGSDFHPMEHLQQERARLGERLFKQEYPESPEEAFITSGECYFDNLALAKLLGQVERYERRSMAGIA
jgi:hypothetical protein